MGARVVFALTEHQAAVLDALRADRSLVTAPELRRAFDVLKLRGLVAGSYPYPCALTDAGRFAALMMAQLAITAPQRG